MTVTISVLLGYLAVLIALGIWGRREGGSLAGYYLAGKKLPYWVVAFSANATGESGWLLLGLTGMGYAIGVQAYWVVLGQMFGIITSWTLISRKLKKLGDDSGAITVPDVLTAKFEDRLHLIRGIAVVILLVMVTTYVTAQMVATGKAFESFLGWDYRTSVIAGSIVIIIYTFVGGYKAVSYTDVVQGVMMLLGLILVPAAAIYASGGLAGVHAALTWQDAGLLDMFAAQANGIPTWIAIVSLMAIGLPFLGVPQMLVRYLSARDDLHIRKARVVSIVVMFMLTFGAVTTGIAGRALFPGLADGETIFPTIANNLFPALISGLLLVVVLSAIMSTVDSLLLLASSAVVRDGVQKIMGSARSDRELAKYGKVVTLLIGVIALAFAVPESKIIFWFVLFAWSGLGAAFGPVIIGILYDRKMTEAGVIAGMLGGFLTCVAWKLWIRPHAFDLNEAVPGFVAGFVFSWVVSRLTQAKKDGKAGEIV